MAAKKKTAKKGKAKAAKRSASKKAKRPAARKSAMKKKAAPKKAAKRPAAKKAAPKKAAKKPAAKKATKKRTPNAAFMKPMQPSSSLAAVVGDKPIPRSEVTKKVWAYIKSKGLQDSKNRRMINADSNLGPVFGGKKQVSMFEMTKHVNKHLK